MSGLAGSIVAFGPKPATHPFPLFRAATSMIAG